MLSRFYKTHFGLTLVSMASGLKVLANPSRRQGRVEKTSTLAMRRERES